MLKNLMAKLLARGKSGDSAHSVEGRTPVMREFGLENFSRLRVGGVFAVTVTPATDYKVQVFADKDLIEGVLAHVQGDTLVLAYDGNFTSAHVLRAEISCPGLVGIEAAGASSVTVGDIAGAALKVKAQGSSRVVLAGSVGELSLTVDGAARVKAKRLTAVAVKAVLRGAGQASAHAVAALDVQVGGGAAFRCHGRPPQCRVRESGAASVKFVTEKDCV